MTTPSSAANATTMVTHCTRDKTTEESLRHEVERLRQRVAELEGRCAPNIESGAEIDTRAAELTERVKELQCLHSIPHLLKGQHELDHILQRIVDVLPSAWQYPELASAVIALKNRRYQAVGFRELRWRQEAPIIVDTERAGTLELGYIGPLPGEREPEFLPEEYELLSTIAERVGEIISLKESQKKLETYQEHLRSLASELTLTEERERRGLALSLHDRIGQGLAVARLKLETLKHLLPAEHQTRLDDISALIKQIVNDTRSLTFEISPPILYELGLRQAIVWLGEHMTRQFGLPVEVRSEDELIALTEDLRVMLFRSIQELLTNTAKHAQASRAMVRLQNDAGELCVVVQDDGIGFDAGARGLVPSPTRGFGLFSIRERIGHLGGRVSVDSCPGKGTRIQISVPGADAEEEK